MALKFLNDGYFAGKVGIGTESPDRKLHVKDSAIVVSEFEGTNTGSLLDLVNSNASQLYNGIRFTQGTSSKMAVTHIADGTTKGYVQIGNSWATGSEILVVDGRTSSVGIGTTSPNEKLEVNGNIKLSSTAGQTATPSYIWLGNDYSNGQTRDKLKIYLYNSGTEQYGFTVGNQSDIQYHSNQEHDFYVANSLKVRINQSGNVGIGTTNIGTQSNLYLGAINSSEGGQLTLQKATGGTLAAHIDAYTTGGNDYMRILSGGDTSTTAAPFVFDLTNVRVGIGTTSPDTSLTIKTGSSAGLAKISSDGNGAAYSANGDVQLYTNNSAYAINFFSANKGSNLMRITDSGNVGIGTTSPTAPLDVFGVRAGRDWSINNRATIRLDANGAGYPSDILFGHTAAANQISWTGAYWSLSSRGSSDNNRFHFYRGSGNPAASSEAILMTLDPNLRVGINNTSPSSTLDVTGTGNFTGLVSGITPVNAANFVTKAYVDGSGGGTGPFLPLAGGTLTAGAVVTFLASSGSTDDRLKFGSSGQMQLFHDGSNGYIVNSLGDVRMDVNTFRVRSSSGTETMIKATQNDNVELYFNNVRKIRTTSGGVFVEGEIKIDSALLSNQNNTDVDTGAEVVAQVSTSTYTAAFFDFVIKKVGNIRSGTVYACHDGTNVEFTETSTQDLGDTSDVTLSVDKSGTNLRLIATVTSDDWIIKSLIRAI